MKRIRTVGQLNKIDFDLISEDEFWNNSDEKELGIHKVHVYPAKFPSLIAQKSLIYAEKHKCIETIKISNTTKQWRKTV